MVSNSKKKWSKFAIASMVFLILSFFPIIFRGMFYAKLSLFFILTFLISSIVSTILSLEFIDRYNQKGKELSIISLALSSIILVTVCSLLTFKIPFV